MVRSTLPSLDMKYLYFPDAPIPRIFIGATLPFTGTTAIQAEGVQISCLRRKTHTHDLCKSIPVQLLPLDLPELSAPLAIAASPEDFAHVMFAYGSTGTPKSVIVPHRAIVRLLSAQHYLAFSSSDTFPLHSPLRFNASTQSHASPNNACSPPRQGIALRS